MSDEIDSIINFFKSFEEPRYIKTFYTSVMNALLTKEPFYIKRFDARYDLTVWDFYQLAMMMGNNDIAEKIKSYDSIGDFIKIVGFEDNQRSAVILPKMVIGIHQHMDTVFKIMMDEWNQRILNPITNRFGFSSPIIHEQSLGFGSILTVSKYKNINTCSIINDIKGKPWKKVELIDKYQIIVKAGQSNALIFLPIDEVQRVLFDIIYDNFIPHTQNILKRETKKITFQEKINKIVLPYKKIIKILEKYISKNTNEIVTIPSPIKNPNEISILLLKLITREEKIIKPKIMWGGRTYFYTYVNMNGIYAYFFPGKILLIKFNPDLGDATDKIEKFIDGNYGINDSFSNAYDGNIYYINNHFNESRTWNDNYVNIDNIKILLRKKNNIIWIPRNELKKYYFDWIKKKSKERYKEKSFKERLLSLFKVLSDEYNE